MLQHRVTPQPDSLWVDMTDVCRKPLGPLQSDAYGRALSDTAGRGRTRGLPAGPRSEVVVSEEDRSRLYAWFREHTDEPLAEYLMSCLAPAPLSDLATKADLARYATKDDLAAGLDRLGDRIDRIDQKFTALREQDRAEATALREQDRMEATAQREQDRIERKSDLRSIKAHHYTVIGFIVALFVANLTIL